MSTNKGKKSGEEGTVLLRQPQPKYNFQGKKLPKESSNEHYNQEELNNLKNVNYITNNGGKPMAVVGASFQGKSVNPDQSTLNNIASMPDIAGLTVKDRSLTEDSADNLGSRGSSSGRDGVLVLPSVSSVPNLPHLAARSGVELSNTGSGPVTPVPASTSLTTPVLQNVQSHFEQTEMITKLKQERDKLHRDLDVQLQVNGELKKLLVASVGEDLSHRMEKLARDRAELTQDLGGFTKKLDEDYENFDKVSIQADMWRSKYLASRVMIEELGNARAYFALQVHDGHDALQQMLNERHELRTNLLENYKVMQQVKNAFDPLNMQRSSNLASTNVLDLARACQQLSEAMRFRLLPANVAMPIGMEGHEEIWQNCVTRAEQFAHEVLSRPCEPSGSIASGSSRLLPITQSAQPINRFHPNQRHENITVNCLKCKGEIKVL